MLEYIQASSLDIAKIAAVIAALVSLVGNAFNIEKRYRALLALAFSILLVLLPGAWLNKVLTAVIVGLMASGVYTQVKPRDYQAGANSNNNQSNQNQETQTNVPINNNVQQQQNQTQRNRPNDEWVDKV